MANFFKDPQNAAWFRNNVINSGWSDIKQGVNSTTGFVRRNIESVKNDVSNFFNKLFGGGKSSGGGTVETAPFPKDGSSSWTGGSGGMSGLNNYVQQQQQEKHKFFTRLREHYESKSGDDFNLSAKEFKYLTKKGNINYNKFVKVGDNRYEVSVNFYGSDSDLALSFGRATLSYSVENGKKVFDGFFDKYDFDSKEWGVRSNSNEVLTRVYNPVSDGKSYNIYYNKSHFNNYEKIYNIPYNINRFNKR